MSVVGEKESVRARRLAKDDALEFELLDACEQFDVLQEIGEVIDDQRIGIFRSVIQGLDHRTVATSLAVGIQYFLQIASGVEKQTLVFHQGILTLYGDLRLRMDIG